MSLTSMLPHQPVPAVEKPLSPPYPAVSQPNANVPAEILPEIIDTEAPPPPEKRHYGISVDAYGIKTDVVKSGQTLSHLLSPHGITKSVVFQAAATAKGVFDVRRMRAGNSYSLIFDPNDNDRIKYFIYDQTLEDYVVFALDKPIQVYAGKKQVETRLKSISGTITSSLWDAAKKAGMGQDVIYGLAEIFSSTMDFGHLHKGDRFLVTFEERFVQGKLMGTGRITAARLTCCANTFQAFSYELDGNVCYYDENGNSLEKSFLKSPLKYSRISSGFSPRRLHPVTKKYRPHPGIDFAAPRGTPVRSVGDGIVIFRGYSKSAGNYVKIQHQSIGTSEYLHLSRFHAGLKKNQRVKKGQLIGYVGSTGYSTGPHLDLRFKRNGHYVDYRKMKLPDGTPLADAHKSEFLNRVADIKQQWEHKTRISMTPSSEKTSYTH